MVGGERFVLCQVKGINRCWTWNSNVSHASSLANFPSCVKAKRFHPCLSSRHFLPKIIYQIPASNIDSPGWTHLEQPKSAIFTLWFSSVASKKSWANWIIKIPNPVTSGNSDCFLFFSKEFLKTSMLMFKKKNMLRESCISGLGSPHASKLICGNPEMKNMHSQSVFKKSMSPQKSDFFWGALFLLSVRIYDV